MRKVKNFCLLGASGFVAPKHMSAIKNTNNNLIACSDPHQNIGIIDKFFPNSEFYSNPQKFNTFLKKNKKKNQLSFNIFSKLYALQSYKTRY